MRTSCACQSPAPGSRSAARSSGAERISAVVSATATQAASATHVRSRGAGPAAMRCWTCDEATIDARQEGMTRRRPRARRAGAGCHSGLWLSLNARHNEDALPPQERVLVVSDGRALRDEAEILVVVLQHARRVA